MTFTSAPGSSLSGIGRQKDNMTVTRGLITALFLSGRILHDVLCGICRKRGKWCYYFLKYNPNHILKPQCPLAPFPLFSIECTEQTDIYIITILSSHHLPHQWWPFVHCSDFQQKPTNQLEITTISTWVYYTPSLIWPVSRSSNLNGFRVFFERCFAVLFQIMEEPTGQNKWRKRLE